MNENANEKKLLLCFALTFTVKTRDYNLVALFVFESCLFGKINTRTLSDYSKFLIISNLRP